MDQQTNNELLLLGSGILIIGLVLGSYSFSTYLETKELSKKIDFELIDDNNELSATEKYHKYISIADFLNKKLTKNKDILIKNASCVYLDYAQHNAIQLHQLTKQKFDIDENKKTISAGNIRTLHNMLENYKTCKKTPLYKAELQIILDEIQNKKQHLDSEERMKKFLNGYNEKKAKELEIQNENSEDVDTQNSLILDTIPEEVAEKDIENIQENSTSKTSNSE